GGAPGRRGHLDRGVDPGQEGPDPAQPRRGHEAPHSHPRRPRAATGRAALGIGHRLLRRPRRRDPPRGERGGLGRARLGMPGRGRPPAAAAGIRVVHARLGVVLSPSGGALAKLLGAFRTGMGGPIGGGRQYVSWIAMEDAIGAIGHGLATGATRGPINVAAPHPVTPGEFARTLARVLGRPALVSVPAFGVKLMLGEMAGETVLASQRLAPTRLLATGYAFRWPDLEPALRHLLAA